MLDEGILHPRERAQLRDGFVMVPDRSRMPFRPVRADLEPEGGVVPSDQQLLEAPPASRERRQEAEIDMNALARETEEPLIRRKFNVDEYYRMAEVGILSPDERIELLDGEIVIMAAMGSRHIWCLIDLEEEIQEKIGRRASKAPQIPVRLATRYAPEPDIMLLRRNDGCRERPGPTGADVLLAIEISDTTIGNDRRVKLPAYARAGIPETWLVDVNAQVVEMYTDPQDGAYQNYVPVDLEGVLTPSAFPDVEIFVRDVMRW